MKAVYIIGKVIVTAIDAWDWVKSRAPSTAGLWLIILIAYLAFGLACFLTVIAHQD